MRRVEKTVFLSYRREDIAWTLAIDQSLTSHGYDVFYDYKSIGSGDWERIIQENIRARAHFLLLLTVTALAKCSNPRDMLRREIQWALDYQCNIVPLMIGEFSFDVENTRSALTGKLALLGTWNGLRVSGDRFFDQMRDLRDQYLDRDRSEVADMYMQTLAVDSTLPSNQ